MRAYETAAGSSTAVVEWRRERLLEAGVAPEAAANLAWDCRIDLHALLELIERGCPARSGGADPRAARRTSPAVLSDAVRSRAPHPPSCTCARPRGAGADLRRMLRAARSLRGASWPASTPMAVPGMREHLEGCPACFEDHASLLALLSSSYER